MEWAINWNCLERKCEMKSEHRKKAEIRMPKVLILHICDKWGDRDASKMNI